MFCSTPSNTQCASFADTHHLVDTSACTCGDKGGLLQLSSLGYFRTTVTTATVCLNSAARLVFSARKSVHITPLLCELRWLKVPSGENSVAVMCSCVPLPYWHSAIIPYRDPLLNCRRRFTSASSECFKVDAGHTDHTTHTAYLTECCKTCFDDCSDVSTHGDICVNVDPQVSNCSYRLHRLSLIHI